MLFAAIPGDAKNLPCSLNIDLRSLHLEPLTGRPDLFFGRKAGIQGPANLMQVTDSYFCRSAVSLSLSALSRRT
jgi:hypothetical protein